MCLFQTDAINTHLSPELNSCIRNPLSSLWSKVYMIKAYIYLIIFCFFFSCFHLIAQGHKFMTVLI